RDIALRCPRPRTAGGTNIAVRTSYGGRCAAGRGADGAARRPYHVKHVRGCYPRLMSSTPSEGISPQPFNPSTLQRLPTLLQQAMLHQRFGRLADQSEAHAGAFGDGEKIVLAVRQIQHP